MIIEAQVVDLQVTVTDSIGTRNLDGNLLCERNDRRCQRLKSFRNRMLTFCLLGCCAEICDVLCEVMRATADKVKAMIQIGYGGMKARDQRRCWTCERRRHLRK